MQQTTMFDLLDPITPPRPDYMHGLCACGWLLCGLNFRVLDQPGWKSIRHLWALFPDGVGLADG